MSLKKLAQSLHQYERAVLPELQHFDDVTSIAKVTGLKDVEVVRALQWLENKKAAQVVIVLKDLVSLDKNAKAYLESNLPERIFLQALKDEPIALQKLDKKTKLNRDEVNGCVGRLRRIGAILILKEKVLTVKITTKGIKLLESSMPQELFLKKSFPLEVKSLTKEEKEVFEGLKKRKGMLVLETKKVKIASLTNVGSKLIALGVRDENILDKISASDLRSGSWKGKSYRRYDVTSKVPQVFGGKKQAYRSFIDEVRKKFVALGFSEMDGPIVETDFWDMDALFMPQFHSARDIHDAYYIKKPYSSPVDSKILKRVKETHETGGVTGSSGWQYKFDAKRTMRHLLRTQTTACSARMLASKNLRIPGKYFSIARNFRYDVVDATHLPDFNQTEGIVVEEGLNFRHLVGLLKMFSKEFAGTSKVRIVPAYFPYTEPSVELHAKHPDLGWVELGGAGMFRPEVVQPLLGKNMSVCAWGLGIDRLAMFKLGFKDIRNLFSHDIDFLRKTPVI